MANKIDLSVIVPCRNLEKEIVKLIDSFKKQELGDYIVELIFVCDSCTDGTYDVILSNADDLRMSGYKSIMIFEVDCNSAGLSRNNGLRMAHGKHIYFCDGDDWLLKNDVFKKILDAFLEYDPDIVRFDWDSEKYKRHEETSMVWQYCYTRKIIGAERFNKENYGEDYYFNCNIWNKCPKTHYINEKFYFYNYGRPNSNCMLHESRM